jgi:hypothetical protein
MFGRDYAWVGLRREKSGGETLLGYAGCHDADTGCEEHFEAVKTMGSDMVTLRMTVASGGGTVFSYLDEEGRFKALGEIFQATPGRWVGAKVGLFARIDDATDGEAENFVDVDSIRFHRPP